MNLVLIILLLLLGAFVLLFIVPKLANPTRIYLSACLALGYLFIFWFNNLDEYIVIKILLTIMIISPIINQYFKWKKSATNEEHN
ncbi:MAG: hypothetical protein ABIW38_13310 [Ferruginibacter sp.]